MFSGGSYLGRVGMADTSNCGLVAENLAHPVADRIWHRALMALVRFRAWLLGSVYTSGSLAVVLRDDGSLLFVKPWYRQGWGLPGGTMKHGEQSIDTLRRELVEETGLVVEIDRIHEVYVQKKRRHIDHLFVVRVGSNQTPAPRKRGEISDIAWRFPDNLPPLQREAHEALLRVSESR
jgi:8-oxo-dGTP diphosphatase